MAAESATDRVDPEVLARQHAALARVRKLGEPALRERAGPVERFPEGCLSLPGVWAEVERPARVRMRARNQHGEEVVVEAEGSHASVLQHELDHLDGILMLDRLDREARREAMRVLREAGS